MASFWGTLGDIAGGIVDVLDPTPGNIASQVIRGGATRVLTGGGGGGVSMTPAVGGGALVPYQPPSSLGPYAEYLVPDVIERAIGTIPDAGCAPGPVLVQPQVTQRLKAPPGYRIVECPRGSGQKVAMREETARKYGYLSPKRKPPISVKDWRALVRADRTVKKLDRVVQMSNRVVGKRRLTRSSPRTCKTTTRKR